MDIAQLVVSLKHVYDVHYLLSIDNYFVIFSLIFDKGYMTVLKLLIMMMMITENVSANMMKDFHHLAG